MPKALIQFNLSLPPATVRALRAAKRRLKLTWEEFFAHVLELLKGE